jgi:hypothetical protein
MNASSSSFPELVENVAVLIEVLAGVPFVDRLASIETAAPQGVQLTQTARMINVPSQRAADL